MEELSPAESLQVEAGALGRELVHSQVCLGVPAAQAVCEPASQPCVQAAQGHLEAQIASLQQGVLRLRDALEETQRSVHDMTPAEADVRVRATMCGLQHADCGSQLVRLQKQACTGQLLRTKVRVQKQMQAIELDFQGDEDIANALRAQTASMHLDIAAAEEQAAALRVRSSTAHRAWAELQLAGACN